MKVILTSDVKGTGKKGQVIEASDGYAKNFLIPRKLGVEATKENVNTLENNRKKEETRRRDELQRARDMKEALEGKIIKIPVKTGGKGKLFGSVTNKEIAEGLELQTGLLVDRKKIVIPEAIRTTGQKHVDIKLHAEVTAKLTIEIIDSGEL
jgi:large subunit ribosomal protein L9